MFNFKKSPACGCSTTIQSGGAAGGKLPSAMAKTLKFKVFESTSAANLEVYIGAWLRKNPGVSVVSSAVDTCAIAHLCMRTVTIWYRS